MVIAFELYANHWMVSSKDITHTARHGTPTRYNNTEDWFAGQAGTAVERRPRSDFNIQDVPLPQGRVFDCAPDRVVLVLDV